MPQKLSPEILDQINCPTCISNVETGLVNPGRLVQMDVGYNGFKVYRVGSPRFFAAESWPNRSNPLAPNIVHLKVPLIDFARDDNSRTGLERHHFITDGLRPDPPIHAFFHVHICPRISKKEAAPFPNRRRRQTTTK